MKEKHIIAYCKTALNFAQCSTATRLKVGAICVKDDKIISIGYNGSLSGWDNCCENEEGKTKPTIIHAEANCIAKLAKVGGGAENSIMFCTHSPCLECAKLIATSGIKSLYYITAYRSTDGIDFLIKAGCNVIKIELNIF
jgi:dCMP deaminase